jgi:dihydrolipoamide dehydrogenase
MTKKTTHYDVIVIGAGPAGYSCAIRAAQLGLKTACVDNWRNSQGLTPLGGAHLNAGCVASLTLLESAKLYHSLQQEIQQHGIYADNVRVDLAQMVGRKDQIINKLSHKIGELFTHHKIDHICARAKLLKNREIALTPSSPSDADSIPATLTAKHIVLATGSSPIKLSCAKIDNEYIIDSFAALNMAELPKKIAIIGAGVIGLELASIWNRLGSETILLDAQETFLPLPDHQIAREAYRIFTRQGFDLRLGARVIAAKKGPKRVAVEYQDQEGTHILRVDKLIVASGRKPNTENLAAPEANLLLDETGYVHVDENCRTNLPSVYAIGDLTLLGPMLAHKGIEEGVFVAEQIAGLHSDINYGTIPSVIYTDPEIAWVGQTEQALKAMGIAIKTGSFPFSAIARAQAIGKTDGLVKIITDAETDNILGVHIIGAGASEMIAEAVLAMEYSASSEDLARTIHVHPTLSETLHEAALALKKRTLHLP